MVLGQRTVDQYRLIYTRGSISMSYHHRSSKFCPWLNRSYIDCNVSGKRDIYYPKKDCGRRCYGGPSMIALTQDTNALLSSLKTKPLNGFMLRHTILFKCVVLLTTNLLTFLATTINFILLEKSNMKFIKYNTYDKERNI